MRSELLMTQAKVALAFGKPDAVRNERRILDFGLLPVDSRMQCRRPVIG